MLHIRVFLFYAPFLLILIELRFNLCRVDVGVEPSHDGEYHADNQKQRGEQNVLSPLKESEWEQEDKHGSR